MSSPNALHAHHTQKEQINRHRKAVEMSSVSSLTLWYFRFWNSALESEYLPRKILKKYLDGSFRRLISTPRRRRALPWLSESLLTKISSIFLNCFLLRKLIPIVVNLGFFFDRMIEYSIALRSAPISSREVLLDIGPYYSFFPSYLSSHSYTISLDLDRNAMIFQKKVSKTMGKNISERLECILADSTRLPFRDDALDKIFVISTIEHISKDSIIAKECGRVLKQDGCCVMSFSFSKSAKKSMIKPYLCRFYTRKMILDRIVVPSRLSLEKLFTFSKTFLSSFYAAVPEGWFIFKDLMIGLTLFKLEGIFLSKDKEGTLAVIKLHKD